MAEAYFVGDHPLTKDDLKTVPFDARFPYCNQTKNCWQNYVDFYRCQKKKGEFAPECKQFWKAFNSLCPQAWIEDWDEKRLNGTFPYKGGL